MSGLRAPGLSITSLHPRWGPPAILAGDTRSAYNHVFDVYVPIGVGVFALMVALIAFAVLRGRRRPADRAARWAENNRLEIGYAALLTLVVAFLLALTYHYEDQEDAEGAPARAQMTIDVSAAKWEWTFRYPSLSITRRSGEVGDQALVVPIDTPILFRLSSVDVIHAMWVPELRFKRDLIPGHVNDALLTFTRPGTFAGECAEFCGLFHTDMRFSVQVVSRAAFTAWTHTAGARS